MRMLLLVLAPLALGRDIYIRENPDGTVTFTDTPASMDGFQVFVDGVAYPLGAVLPPPTRVNLTTFPLLDTWDDQLLAASLRYGVPAELLKAVCVAESGMNPNAISHAGAQGLMQLMPGTAAELAVSDPFDPHQSIDGGARYLARQIKRFGSIRLGLAAYNAGPDNVAKHNGVPPFQETRTYVVKVMALYDHFRYQRPISPTAGLLE
ncbi:MAG: lytic transglycosylase domain-containing protein [Alphaproteobacteria bacterium]|nr:lytic transglycosylase domain-containing protein [Alphaproteobacteria bacterium]